jgi:hypothetical protein
MNGHPGGETPMVVVTHHPPRDWPRDGVPVFFEGSVEAAVARARELAEVTEDRGVTHLRYRVRS